MLSPFQDIAGACAMPAFVVTLYQPLSLTAGLVLNVAMILITPLALAEPDENLTVSGLG